MDEFLALFFPNDIAGVDISSGVWHPRQNFVVEIETETDCVINRNDVLGRIHFFYEETIERTRLGAGMVAAMQSETRTFAVKVDPDDSSGSSSSSSSSDDSDSETPQALRNAEVRHRFQRRDAALCFQNRLTRLGQCTAPSPAPATDDNIEIRWKPWNATVRASFCTPLTYSLGQATSAAEPARASGWKDIAYHDGLSANWLDADGGKTRSNDPRRGKPLRL